MENYKAGVTIKSVYKRAFDKISLLAERFQFTVKFQETGKDLYDALLETSGTKYTDVANRMGLLTAYLMQHNIKATRDRIDEILAS